MVEQKSDIAIRLCDVSKIYRLHGSQGDQLIDVLKLQRLGFRTRLPIREFQALTNIDFAVNRGERIGIIGRNGAGKTTLLKLICGTIGATEGNVEVNGTVQALLGMGMGFHPDYTGRQNVESALRYSGLAAKEYGPAIESIIDFCELEDFFDQPIKVYSSGMQARLMFAAATALHPDILIVDEVLGAGDAYFIAKSKRRVESLINNGCTMLLVSHSMQQVLELCSEAIWIDQGGVRMQGESFEVVKEYEAFLHGPIQSVLMPDVTEGPNETSDPDADPKNETGVVETERPDRSSIEDFLQEPRFLPHAERPEFPPVDVPLDHKFVARGGISRWDGEPGLKITGSTFVTPQGESNQWTTTQNVKCVFTVVGEIEGFYEVRFALCLYDHLGKCVLDIVSGRHTFSIRKGNIRSAEVVLNPLQLGPGEYVVSLSVHDYEELALFNSTKRYDLLSRSLEVSVDLPDSLSVIESSYYHTAEWSLR